MGSEMCIRDRAPRPRAEQPVEFNEERTIVAFAARMQAVDDMLSTCLLYTSDAADERSSVDLGGRRIIKKKNKTKQSEQRTAQK